MSKESRLHAVMEGRGAYNKFAKLPASGAAFAMPLWEDAVRQAEIAAGHEAVILADYGSSQGKNSLIPIGLAIKGLRELLEPGRPIWVFHVDQPSNDFNALFDVLDADPDSYTLGDTSIFPAAVGRSFLRGGFAAQLRPSRVVLVCCSVAQPRADSNPRSFRVYPQHWRSARRI